MTNIKSKDNALFTIEKGLEVTDYPKNFYAQKVDGKSFQILSFENGKHLLLDAWHLNNVTIEGVAYTEVDAAVSALNAFLYASPGNSTGPTFGLGPYTEITFSEAQNLVSTSSLEPGVLYKILDIHSSYNTKAFPVNGYFVALSSNKFSENGYGEFIEPRYDNVPIVKRQELNGASLITGYYAWGNKVWSISGNGIYIDEFTLGGDFVLINSATHEDFNFVYETNLDEIVYDLDTDLIRGRHNKKTNVKVLLTKDSSSDYTTTEQIRFNHNFSATIVSKTTVLNGVVNFTAIDPFLYDKLVNFPGCINTVYIGMGSEFSVYVDTHKNHVLQNIKVASASYLYIYFDNVRLTNIQDITIDEQSGLDISYNFDNDPSAQIRRNFMSIEVRNSSYVQISDTGNKSSIGPLLANNGSGIELTLADGFGGVGNITTLNNSKCIIDQPVGASDKTNITIDNESNLNTTGPNLINGLKIDFKGEVSGSTTHSFTHSQVVGLSLDLATFTGLENNRNFSGLT